MLKHLRFHDQAQYVENITWALKGYDYLKQAGYIEMAHQSLYLAIELILFGRGVYHYKDKTDLDALLALKVKIEQENELEAIELKLPGLIKRLTLIQKENQPYMSDTREMDDQQLIALAETMCRAFGLPPDCCTNVLSELHNCRLFYQRAGNDLELLAYDRNYDQRILYRSPVRFLIQHKKTKLRSVPSRDVAALLESWGQ